MTATETEARNARNGRRGPSDETPTLVDQIVLSSAGTTSQGIATALQAMDGVVGAVDALVIGAFDLAEEVAGRGIAAARLSWTTTVETTRKSLTVL
jgi:hypothetical protein